MNQDLETSFEKLETGTWYARVIRHETDDIPGLTLLIEDREYFFPEDDRSLFFLQRTARRPKESNIRRIFL